MSQAKVDRYKEQKKNRKKIMKRAKITRFLGSCAAVLVCAGIIGWVGWSAFEKYEENKPASYTEVNMDAFTDYYNSLGEN